MKKGVERKPQRGGGTDQLQGVNRQEKPSGGGFLTVRMGVSSQDNRLGRGVDQGLIRDNTD